jgi:hypothetical protein
MLLVAETLQHITNSACTQDVNARLLCAVAALAGYLACSVAILGVCVDVSVDVVGMLMHVSLPLLTQTFSVTFCVLAHWAAQLTCWRERLHCNG